jgi:hypothetical protein
MPLTNANGGEAISFHSLAVFHLRAYHHDYLLCRHFQKLRVFHGEKVVCSIYEKSLSFCPTKRDGFFVLGAVAVRLPWLSTATATCPTLALHPPHLHWCCLRQSAAKNLEYHST